jgi:hypothetical protein
MEQGTGEKTKKICLKEAHILFDTNRISTDEIISVSSTMLTFNSFTDAAMMPAIINPQQHTQSVYHQRLVITDSSEKLRSTIIQHVYGVAVTQNLWNKLVPQFKTFSANEFRFFLDYDSAAYSDVRPARSDFLSCKTPMPNKFPGARGLSFYDVCDEFELKEKSDAPFAVDLSQLLHPAAVPAPVPDKVWAELRKGEVKVFCPRGLPEQTYFQQCVSAEAPALAPTVLHVQTKAHVCVTYDLYLARAPAAGPADVNDAVPAKMNAVTPLLEMFEDRSRPLVQVQVLFRLDVQAGGVNGVVSDVGGFKTAIEGRVNAVLANELNAVTAVNNPLPPTVRVNKPHVSKVRANEKITSTGSFSRKHYSSNAPGGGDITSIVVSHNLNLRLTDTMTVDHLLPRLQYLPGLDNNEKHRYYTADGTYLRAAKVGKRIQRGDANVKAFHLTLHDALHDRLQTCINFMSQARLMTTGHFKLCKIVMNHNNNHNFVVAFAWVPGAAPPAVAPPVNVVTAAAAAATPAAAIAAAQKATLAAPAPLRNRVQSTVDAACVSANTKYGRRITVGDKKEAKVVVDVVKAIRDLLNVGGALPPSEIDSAKSFVAASCGVLGSIIKLCAAVAANPTKTKCIVKAATPAAAPAPGPAPTTISAHLIAPIALQTLVNALPPAPDVSAAVQSAMNAVITLLEGLTASVLRAVATTERRPVSDVESRLCPPSPRPAAAVPPPGRARARARAAPAVPAPAHVPGPNPGRAYTPVFSIMNNDFFETLQVEANIHVSRDITRFDAIPPTADSFDAFCIQANTLVHQTATDFLASCSAEPRFVNFGVAKF